MPDTTGVPGSRRRRIVLMVGVALVMLLVAAVGTAIVWRRSGQVQATGGLFGLFPALQKATGELGRGLMDGGALSVRFITDLREKRWHEAYQSTSRGFRQRMDEASFERFVKESQAITDTSFNFDIISKGVTFNGQRTAPKGGVWLLLIAEDEAMKVERLALSERVTP